MSSEEEDRNLIDHFIGVEPFSGFRIGGGHDLGGQIFGRSPRLNLRHSGAREVGDQGADPLRRLARGPREQPRHPARQGNERPEVQQGLAALVGFELCKDIACDTVLDRDREQRAKDHVGCGMARFGLHLNGLTTKRLQATYGCVRCLPHRGEGFAQASALEGRVNDAALPLPLRAVGQKHGISQQRAQAFADAVGLGEIVGPLPQNRPDQIGLVDHVAAKERRPEFRHPRPIKPRGLRGEDIAPEQPCILQQRDLIGPRGRLRRLGHAAMEVNLLTALSMRDREGGRPAYR